MFSNGDGTIRDDGDSAPIVIANAARKYGDATSKHGDAAGDDATTTENPQ